MRAQGIALAGACLAALALAGCGKPAETATAQTPPSDDEVRSALRASYQSHAGAEQAERRAADFARIKVVGCSKSAKEGFECEFVNAGGQRIRDRFARGSGGWEAVERIGG